MKYLLDTHTFLWWINDDPRLSAAARRTLAAGEDELFLSAASAWEIAIKAALGRIVLPEPGEKFIPDQLQKNRITPLSVQVSHALAVERLPLHHRDLFDRLLVAQASLEGMPIVTGDFHFAAYDIEVVW